MPKWEAKVYGSPKGDARDAVQTNLIYAQLKRGKSELIENQHWNDVKNLVIQERARRGLDTSQVVAYIPPGEITADVFMNLVKYSNINGVYDDSVAVGDWIKNESLGINDVVQRIMVAGEYCVCDCNYCSCDCNQCTCNCDYACTCDCAFQDFTPPVTVSFDTQGGSAAPAPIMVDSGTTWGEIKERVPEPVKTGKRFAGWVAQEDTAVKAGTKIRL